MTIFKWTIGRQDTGYKKFCIMSLLNFDVYLLKFPMGSYVPSHKDVVEGKEHYRLNIWLRRPRGGAFWTAFPKKYYGNKRWVKFRPDLVFHGMTEVTGASAGYMLSIGWTKHG